MKFIMFVFLLGAIKTVSCQQVDIDSINFYDDSQFKRKIHKKDNGQLDYVEYLHIGGGVKKVVYYDAKQRIRKDQVWKEELIKETKYSYYEKGQIVKRYDVLNQRDLSPEINVHMKYPVMALENQIEGVVEVSFSYDENCVPISFEILNKLGYGIDEEVKKKMNLMIQLSEKYNVPFKQCERLDENFKVEFTLD